MEQKSRRNLLSIVFMLAMVIGLVTGMDMMAHADDAGGTDDTYVYIDVGTDHAGFFKNLFDKNEEWVASLKDLTNADYARITYNTIILVYNNATSVPTEKVLQSKITEAVYPGEDWLTDKYENFEGVGYKPLDEYATFQECVFDTYVRKHTLSDEFMYYLLWSKPLSKIELSNGNPICGKGVEDAIPILPDGIKLGKADVFEDEEEDDSEYPHSEYYWENEEDEEDEVEFFEGGKEYVCTVWISVDINGAYWRNSFTEDYLNVSVSGGKDVEINVDEPILVQVKFKVTVDHVWDAGKVTKEPTTTAEGEKTYKCKHCDATKTEAIPKKTIAPIPEDTTQIQQTVEQITIARRPGIKNLTQRRCVQLSTGMLSSVRRRIRRRFGNRLRESKFSTAWTRHSRKG